MQRNRDIDVENNYIDTKGGKGGGMTWELGIDIHTLICTKYITNENLLFITGNSPQYSVVT